MSQLLKDDRWIDVGNGISLPDIAGLVRDRLENPSGLISKADPSELGEILVRQLAEGASPSTGGLRLSGSGKCKRALAYDYHHYEPNGFKGDASAPLVFATGDILELILVTALEEAIVGTPIEMYYTGTNQKTVSLSVPLTEGRTAKIAGHPDGLMRVPAFNADSGEMETISVVLEIKSMSDYAFKKFRSKGLERDDGYSYQANAYQLALTQEGKSEFNWTYMLSFGKSVTAKDCVIRDDGSHYKLWPIVGKWIRGDDELKLDIQERLKEVILSERPEDFQRIQSPATAKKKEGQLAFPCDWCSHWKTCWPSAYEKPVASGWFQRTTKMKLIAGE